jgi:ribonuclease P/MRP protein subunit POP1
LREKQWIASDVSICTTYTTKNTLFSFFFVLSIEYFLKTFLFIQTGIPFFPQDFPDCKAYSCFMAAKAAECNEKEELRPPSVRNLRVPILPPWDIVHATFNKEFSTTETLDLSAREDLTNANSLSNSCSGNFEISNLDSEDSFDGTVARTGCMMTTLLDETKTGRLLLFPYAADGKARISKFIKGELMLDTRHKSSVIYDRKLCFIRVHLHPFKERFFEEGAVICAPHPSDISLWTSR